MQDVKSSLKLKKSKSGGKLKLTNVRMATINIKSYHIFRLIMVMCDTEVKVYDLWHHPVSYTGSFSPLKRFNFVGGRRISYSFYRSIEVQLCA